MNTNKVIGLHLKGERIKKNITAKEIAEKINKSESAISRIENGSNEIKINELFEICEHIEIDSLELLRQAQKELKKTKI